MALMKVIILRVNNRSVRKLPSTAAVKAQMM